MRKITVLLAAFCLAALAYLFFRAPRVCFGFECVPVELALTQAEQERGLMYRTGLDGGMLFVFPKADRYGFWMKNMDFPIDIVWFSADKMVVGVSRDVPPCADPCPVYYPGAPVRYVLEVPANYSLAKGIREGGGAAFIGVAD